MGQGTSRFADYLSPCPNDFDQLLDSENNPFAIEESLRTEIERDLDARFDFSEPDGEICAMRDAGEEMNKMVAAIGKKPVGLEHSSNGEGEGEGEKMVMNDVPVELEEFLEQLSREGAESSNGEEKA